MTTIGSRSPAVSKRRTSASLSIQRSLLCSEVRMCMSIYIELCLAARPLGQWMKPRERSKLACTTHLKVLIRARLYVLYMSHKKYRSPSTLLLSVCGGMTVDSTAFSQSLRPSFYFLNTVYLSPRGSQLLWALAAAAATWKAATQSFYTYGNHCSILLTPHMIPALRRHQAALPAKLAFNSGAGHSAAARSQHAAASISSAAERGPASQAPGCPVSTIARIR